MSGSGPVTADLDRIVDYPWEVLEYLTWLRQQPASRDATGSYLFDQPQVRFAVAEGDLLVAEADIVVSSAPGGLRLTSRRAPSAVEIEGLGEAQRGQVEALLLRFDGQSALASVRAGLPAADGRVLDALLSSTFGKLIFAPLALLDAERSISGVEITRFPGSPYELARPYWTNMGAVRRRSSDLFASLADDERFARELRKLHVISLMGEDLQSYYQPASPISSGRAAPGRFMLTASQLVASREGTVFVAGPRVSAAPVGGVRYQELLYSTLDEPEAALPRAFRSSSQLDWGQIVQARAASDAADAAWYCPPRPLRHEHLRALRESLASADAAARSAKRGACLDALAAFHQDFVRLHPFHCGNQSLAMNLVNAVATRALGAGMPHLVLDHLAVRLSPGAYARVFRRAVSAYVDPRPNAAARYLRLASHRTRTFDLLRQLEAAKTLAEAGALARADAESERLLLLTDE